MLMGNAEVPFSELEGKVLVDVQVILDDIVFFCDDGTRYLQTHIQDCCEDVSVEDVCGDLDDLIGSPILQAEEVSGQTKNDMPAEDLSTLTLQNRLDGLLARDDSVTWTFYKLRTRKGAVTIRWWGSSNGYYSEKVSLIKESNDD